MTITETTDTTTNTPDEDTGIDALDALASLKAEQDASTSHERPPRVDLKSIRTCPEVFQPRNVSEHHVSELAKAIKARGEVDPILVIKVGTGVVVIDGHHRRAAYERAGVKSGIPVSYFEGTLDEAVLEAGKANTKLKLGMSSTERQDFAWRLVLMGKHSKREIVDSANVSNGQVGNMRKVREELGARANDLHRWKDARRAADGLPDWSETDDERQLRLQALADDYADRLAKTFGTKLARNTEVAAMALEVHFGRKLPELLRELQGFVAVEEDGEEDDF